jgi:hypothetical protein
LRAYRRQWNAAVTADLPDPPHRHVRGLAYRRGFVESVTVPSRVFIDHAEHLVRLGLLRGVKLTDADGSIRELTATPAVARLTELDLSSNRLGYSAAEYLARCRYLFRLRTLDLRDNPIGEAGIDLLRRSFHLRRATLLSDWAPPEGPPPRMSALPPRTVTPLVPPPEFREGGRPNALSRFVGRLRRWFE